MKTLDENYGKCILRIGQDKDGGWIGVVIQGGKILGEKLHDDDRERLRARLMNVAGTVHPNYFGMEGAIARFLQFMPGGFSGQRYTARDGERRYKVDAHNTLTALLPLAAAANATNVDGKTLAAAFKKDQLWTHMPSLQESTRLREILAVHGSAFLRAAAAFANGDFNTGIAGMRNAIAPHGTLTWPIATYLPFLWSPDKHMFLKPTATRDFAERIGHRFAIDYDSEIRADVYQSLLDLADDTAAGIAQLNPADRIDVQSFIWVVGEYREENRT
ncbi:hypothetical protein J8J14_21410 [Roseomonas sp. SSH11]|uniref:Uncharacterized protein n=1 Tax=Pararoseomonas baculiformis TaxID=2820812 RepID=A0ABS4AJW9_9PROT|nr:hypothetical protein [Pararoseomonas baculiformis]MBP0447330.1 hypothetical protein [Pararoseomonas baculiformis]